MCLIIILYLEPHLVAHFREPCLLFHSIMGGDKALLGTGGGLGNIKSLIVHLHPSWQ